MSEENVDLVRRVVDAVNSRDAEAFAAAVSPDVEWHDRMFWMEGSQTFRGRAEVRGWFDQILEPWENLQFEAGEIREASGDRLFAEFILTASGRESGAETRLHFWTLSRIADGLIAKRQVYLDRAEALQAAGLSG